MRVLVTGGAGFIGSNLVKALLEDSSVEFVRVIDNLITGNKNNLAPFLEHSKFEFLEKDIRDKQACDEAMRGITHISHQAALGSVPRSIQDPVTSNEHNVIGTLNILQTAKEQGIQRIVFASSSSVYGDDLTLPKEETKTGKVLSPYALTKRTKEEYARLFSELYGLSIIGFRYFNVFGPNQSPKGAYAAVIPIFMSKLNAGETSTIHGDGGQSRDFTFIENVVSANLLALKAQTVKDNFQVFNIALGEKTSVKELYYLIAKIMGKDITPEHSPPRKGDIRDSLANISKIKEHLGYQPLVTIEDGLRRTVNWFLNEYEK